MSELRHRSPKKVSSQVSISDADDSVDDSENEKAKIAKANPKEPVSLEKVLTRSLAACVMFAALYMTVYAGHFYCICLTVVIQIELYRELVNVRYVEAKQRAMPWFRSLQWAWFYVAMLTIYGESTHKFVSENRALKPMTAFTKQYNIISYAAFCILFVVTVLTLRPGLLRFQISQFLWSIVTVCFVLVPSKFATTNILRGLFWFLFPIGAVIANDVTAYFCGITFGRKFISAPFLSLSPNKTWEGFIGAAFLTIIFSFLVPYMLAQYTWMTCPAEELYLTAFSAPLACVPHAVFTETVDLTLPFFGPIRVLQIQMHGLAFGLFASLVAPFGGFFASAVKRAYKIKDFDSFVPGHGGVMDRMDCQLLMIAFAAFYYSNFINPSPSLARMEFLVSMMTPEDQLKLLETLKSITSA